MKCFLLAAVLWAGTLNGVGQTNNLDPDLRRMGEMLGHLDAKLTRQMNELLWFQRLGEVAVVDKVRFTGPPPRGTNQVVAASGSNHVVISALSFLPRARARAGKRPLIVFAHGEIHGNVASDEEVLVVRELVQQGYAVIAPDYRGSSGYGEEFWRQIDYGGLEVADVHAARQYMLERYPEIDLHRVGIMGWSHGGMIALLTVFAHPEAYQACYAGVPVSDLEERLRIRGQGYEQLFAAPYHLGKTFAEDPDEYHRRSPAWNAGKLRTPLLVQANTNDEDVNIREVERLITALKAADKDFQYHLYTNAPGGHQFNRLDTPLARAARAEIWRFLAQHLRPPHAPR
ncbi:MAG TPA: alpha/beta fold hydrolase [Candidatus Sulfotelmatobacter sp.]|nr:alpha/beta fold hydrolase [Candidatus Sulfotelmatobacter sp.]